jgi:hypothetical protein
VAHAIELDLDERLLDAPAQVSWPYRRIAFFVTWGLATTTTVKLFSGAVAFFLEPS